MKRFILAATLVVSKIAFAQTVADSPELYSGERMLYEAAKKDGIVVSFDTGPTWANWAGEFAAFRKRYPNVEITYNDIGSGATVVALDKARNRPQADTAYYFAPSAYDAIKKDVVAPFKPVNFEKLPQQFRDPDGRWFTVHSLTVAFVINKKLAIAVPHSWADLLKPEFKNSIVYLDPRSTGVGQVVCFAANFGSGGDMGNLAPGFAYFEKLHKAGNVMRVEGATPYAKFIKGEIPVWISYESDGLKAKYIDGMGDDVEVVIPSESSVAAPYAMSLVKNDSHPSAGKLWLNFVMTELGQTIFSQGYVRPSVPGVALPADIAARLPPAPQVRLLDVATATDLKAEITAGWAKAALGQ